MEKDPFQDMSAVRPGGRISLMREPEKSAPMLLWSSMKRAGTGTLS